MLADRRLPALLLVLAVGPLLTGCPNPNTYGTPRTVPKGKISHTVAAEMMGFSADVTTTSTDSTGQTVTTTETVGGSIPVAPTYQMRIGVAEPVDIGVRVANLSTLGADVKVNFLKGGFDMAIGPGFQVFRVGAGNTSVTMTYLHAPLMLGINLGQSVALVLTPGLMYGVGSAQSTTSGEEAATTTSGVIGRAGFGAEFVLMEKFALHPELTMMLPLGESPSNFVYLFGLGFNFGALPDRSDLE